MAQHNYKHGHTANRKTSSIFAIYSALKRRCNNPNDAAYDRYGGRGIEVCERWMEKDTGFINFFEDMGDRPSKNHSLDRIDNEKGYSSENCRWATAKEQANNRRSNHILEFDGKKMNVSQWAKDLNLSVSTIFQRIKKGYSIEEILLKGRVHRKSDERIITYKDKTQGLAKWVKELGIPRSTITNRLDRGMSIEEALSKTNYGTNNSRTTTNSNR